MDKKVVFITGASRGIGVATARKFADGGWRVAGFYRNSAGPEIENVKYYQLDVSDWESVNVAFDKAYGELGRVDCLVNNAGVLVDKRLQGYEVEDMEKVMRTNELGVYLCTKKVLDKMEEGAIVNLCSTAAQAGSMDPIYAGTKGAVWSFTKSMAMALAPRVRVNCVAPGLVNTDMGNKGWGPGELEQRVKAIPMGRMAEPKEVASGIYFLASDEAGHITGATLDINGGYVLR
ncbi:hypothetical protein A2634_02360 [Candidatus Amesbacteria bacterium RIFCSPHIGHO2_01_FULL_48_32]|uniref:Short-chain dehydrogenase n=1 Tax=Candidatus Amesbacteria bacterium RIFCSPLOWO2_01_FULL_48_25 TaxID=1797259 RepID=A0A1F4ZDX5_9BACT|nr:MAG: hypothetical protein A2634_02360 [Candidatus Amesbacteria bacterium RIFCSPHIGHO2_01_FULL_48_32]OGD04428.1 MAG: hypothetical protein A2989_05365 [Candidatus Amesbacteria bacterium RIFCSPLOWO2_01_FULL_48_25]HJZ06269.1 SDR family oxidoreductase [Patescibacteria group bacterium]